MADVVELLKVALGGRAVEVGGGAVRRGDGT